MYLQKNVKRKQRENEKLHEKYNEEKTGNNGENTSNGWHEEGNT